MKVAALFILLLSNEGHWLSGTEGRIRFSWNAAAAATRCELMWDLKLGDTRLGQGRMAIGPAESPVVRIACPEVRADRTAMELAGDANGGWPGNCQWD